MAPMIDKAVAEAGEGRTMQVVIDIDRQRLIAEQFRIQSVPTVYAFVGGQPVDGFVGAKSEREIKAFIERLLATLPPTETQVSLDAMMDAANALLADGNLAAAVEAFAAIGTQAPDREDAVAGYARALIAMGDVDTAQAALSALPADSKEPAVVQARAALELVRLAVPAAELEALEARITADANDQQARIDLAKALFAAGRRDEAADHLLAAIAADREWGEGAARAQLLKLIEAQGFSDPWSVAARRRLSHLLFA